MLFVQANTQLLLFITTLYCMVMCMYDTVEQLMFWCKVPFLTKTDSDLGMTGSTVPGQAEASPLAAAERHPSLNEERFVFLRQQGKVLARETTHIQQVTIHITARRTV